MHVKSGKERALWGSVQTRWLGRGEASGALLAQVSSPLVMGGYFWDPACSQELWLEVCFSIHAATTPQHRGPYRGHHSVLISLLQ